MTPTQFKKARQTLGLTLEQMGALIGYQGGQIRSMVHRLETGDRVIREPQRRLVEAYLQGYRPKDWPNTSNT